MNKKIITSITLSIVLFLTFVVSPIYALSFPLGEIKKELRNEVREDKKEIRNDIKELKNDTKDLKKDLKKPNLNRAAKILNGEVKSKDGSNLTVEKDGKTYTVQTDGNTQFRRHFWGK